MLGSTDSVRGRSLEELSKILFHVVHVVFQRGIRLMGYIGPLTLTVVSSSDCPLA